MFKSRRSRSLLSLLMLCIFLSTFITDMSVIMDDTEDAPPIDFHRILGEKKNRRKHGKTRKHVRHRGKNKVAIGTKNDASVGPVNDPQSHLSDAEDQTQRAIMLISFGKSAAEGTLLERCILSIRRRGHFQDAIVVITDAPEDRYKGEFDENVFVVKANEDDILYDHFKAAGQKYKRFKTLLIDYFNGLVDSGIFFTIVSFLSFLFCYHHLVRTSFDAILFCFYFTRTPTGSNRIFILHGHRHDDGLFFPSIGPWPRQNL